MSDVIPVELGDRVRDRVSGIEGIATARTQWLNGCERWSISPRAGEDGKLPDDVWVDQQQVELCEKDPELFFSVDERPEKRLTRGAITGGPTSSVDRMPQPR